MVRIIHDTRESSLANATTGGGLWLDAAEIRSTTGWDWKHQGLCREDTCIPVPDDGGPPMVDGDRLDIAAIWRHAGWPAVHDERERLWVLGEGASRRGGALSSLQAPDFELPDLQGRTHRLSELRGKRVFLSTWASW